MAASVSLAKARGCPNIFYGSLRRYQPHDFSLILTSYAANADRPHHAMTLKPSAFDPDTLPSRHRTANSLPGIAILIGGDSGTVRYRDGDWRQLLALIRSLAIEGRQLLVANSRRTPRAISAALAILAKSTFGQITFLDVGHPGSAGLVDVFAACDGVAVTIDSSSMVSEAIWARKPVVVLTPAGARLPALEQAYRDYLQERGWTTRLALADADCKTLAQRFLMVAPLMSNPLDDLATLLQQRLPHLF